ncbi:hypothetical protein JGH11_15375 [Dysgonomonas sp. Marseille-P4677]|uniref:hypothetical protein n=1 Tax=Dysgonomonas sp. Marseille-P4677 TaxID=2364790 RepID=UPI001914D291|nr:hypothetical protein [Dysgonomonas sp. Marseille-P4677]MBK5722256.1 hypothetical protein [Dysgonomonas sp. Marseille-P4677]
MRHYNTIWMLIILMLACSNESELIQNKSNLNSKDGNITFLQEREGVSVLIFSENSNDFKYIRSIISGWSTDGKVSTQLFFGKYRFLFIRSAGINTSFSVDTNTSFEDIKIVAKNDPLNENYVLPVDEIWLPETKEMAETIYTITGETTVYNKLTRAVSQIVIHLKRGSVENGEITEYPFPEGINITENIKEIKLDINGVGEAVNYIGGIGFTKTQETLQESSEITEDGFTTFQGPFVFPPATQDLTNIGISIIPADDKAFAEIRTSVSGRLARNKKLEITLLMTETHQLIDIIVDTNPITEISQGDSGIWE